MNGAPTRLHGFRCSSVVQEAVESIVAAFILPARVSCHICPCCCVLHRCCDACRVQAHDFSLVCLHAARCARLHLPKPSASLSPPTSTDPEPSPPCLPCPQDLKSLQSIKSKMAGGAARQSMALHAGGGPLGPSMLSRTSTPNVDLIKVGVGAGRCWQS